MNCPVCVPGPDSMVLITDKFWGPTGAENVIGSVHLWLAEAINALQDNKDTLTAKVRAGGCRGEGRVAPDMVWRPSRTPAFSPRSSRAAGTPR